MRMPPSVDSNTQAASACLTRSTMKKRLSRSSNVVVEDRRKKSRGSSSLSQTSPPRSNHVDLIGQVTQESEQKRSCPHKDAAYNRLDLPSRQPQQWHFPSSQKIDGILKRAMFRKEDRLANEGGDGTVKTMILQLASLTDSILIAYDKEKALESEERSASMAQLAQERTAHAAVASEVARLLAINEAVTLESTQFRISNETTAAEVAKLQLENAILVEKEAEASSKLDDILKQSGSRDAINILSAFMMSKALMLKGQPDFGKAGNSESKKLRLEKAQIIKRSRDVAKMTKLQNLNLQSSLVVAERELSKLRSENAELIQQKDEREARTSSAMHDMLCRLEAANKEVMTLRFNTEALLRKRDEAAAKAAEAAALKLKKVESRNETLLRENHTAKETADAEMERMKRTLESTAATLKKVHLEKEEMAREKVESESRMTMEIIQLKSDKAATVAELERTSAMANREFKTLNSRLEDAIKKLESVRHTTGLEKAKLQSEIQAKSSELARLKKNLIQMQADMATRETQRAAEVHSLSREKDEGRCREGALLEKLQAATALRKPIADMHLAFLINWGLIRPEDYRVTFMPQSRSR